MIDDVGILPEEKALFLAVLASRFPQQYERFADMAEHLSVQPGGSTPLVRQVIQLGAPDG